MGVHAHLVAGVRIDEHQLARILERLLARIAHLDHQHVMAGGESCQRHRPVARTAQVAHDHEQRALAGHARRVLESVAQRR